MADALSTAFALIPETGIAAMLPGLPGVDVHLLRTDGTAVLLRGA